MDLNFKPGIQFLGIILAFLLCFTHILRIRGVSEEIGEIFYVIQIAWGYDYGCVTFTEINCFA